MKESEALEWVKELKGSEEILEFYYAESFIKACDMAIQALKKQIPMKPDFTEDKEFALCPCCNGKGLLDKQKYCDNCGQKLDWSEESEE